MAEPLCAAGGSPAFFWSDGWHDRANGAMTMCCFIKFGQTKKPGNTAFPGFPHFVTTPFTRVGS